MPDDPHMALQLAIVGMLKADAGVAALIDGRVHDEPPASAKFPYCTLGDGQVVPDKAGCIDGCECFINIDVWSRPERNDGWREAKAIAWAIKQALDDQEDLVVPGYRINDLQYQSMHFMRDPDGLTRHAVVIFRALI